MIALAFIAAAVALAADTEGIVKKDLGLAPYELVREYVQRDAEGQFLKTNTWWNAAVECPDCMGGPDKFQVISGFSIKRASELEFTVTYAYEGTLGRDGFVADQKTMTVPFTVAKTAWGYKLRRRAYQMVSLAFVCSHELANMTPAAAIKLKSLCP